MATTISKKIRRFCFRLANGLLIASTFSLAGHLNLRPPAGYAQEIVTGTFNSPELGISLTLPRGWQGQLSDEALVLGSPNEAGGIILTLNQATSVEELVQYANAGFYESGFQLSRSGEFQPVGYNGVGAEFSGDYQGHPVKAFIAGVINPYGESITIFALVPSADYDAQEPTLVQEIARSMRFSAPQVPAVSGGGGSGSGDTPVYIDYDQATGNTTIDMGNLGCLGC